MEFDKGQGIKTGKIEKSIGKRKLSCFVRANLEAFVYDSVHGLECRPIVTSFRIFVHDCLATILPHCYSSRGFWGALDKKGFNLAISDQSLHLQVVPILNLLNPLLVEMLPLLCHSLCHCWLSPHFWRTIQNCVHRYESGLVDAAIIHICTIELTHMSHNDRWFVEWGERTLFYRGPLRLVHSFSPRTIGSIF